MSIIYKSKICSFIVATALLLSSSSCSKFLEESSQDEIKPTTVIELQQLLMGEVYPIGSNQTSFNMYLELMTDDMTSNFNPDEKSTPLYKRFEGPFTWRADMFEHMKSNGNTDPLNTYDDYYKRIKGCNVVLSMIDHVRGTDDMRANVKGQALAMRSYYYFMLVNLFGQPYNAAGVDISTSPGVELVLSPIVKDDFPSRVSVKTIYTQIENDLLEALPMIIAHGSNNNKFKVTTQFVYTLLSRMYLYMENWEQAEKYASLGLSINSSLTKLASIGWPSYYFAGATGVYSLNSVEAIWFGYGGDYEYNSLTLNPLGPPAYSVSQELRNLYQYTPGNSSNRGDLRMRFFYLWEATDYDWILLEPIIGFKGATASSGATKGMRIAELYLNRAEASIQLYLKNGDESLRMAALKDLNTLRSSRYDTRNTSYIDVDFSGNALLDFYKDERRRELSGEDHRWFDLRRYGMPEIRHTLQLSASQAPVEYILKKGDKRYVLPLSKEVLAKNPSLVPNP